MGQLIFVYLLILHRRTDVIRILCLCTRISPQLIIRCLMPKSYMGYSKQITCFSTENAKKCSSKVISNSFNQGNSEIVFVNLAFLTQKRMSLVLVFPVWS